MKIEILGTGCSKCQTMFEHTKQAISEAKLFVELEKVEDVMKIMEYNVMSTPALVINNEVKSYGKVLSKEEILKFIQQS